MATLPLWWVSPQAVNCPLLPSSALPQLGATATCSPAVCGRDLGWACSKVSCFIPLLLKWLQPQQRQQMFLAPPSLLAHSPHGHHGCADHPACTPFFLTFVEWVLLQHLGMAIQTLSLSPILTAPQQCFSECWFLRDKSLCHFLK